MRHWFLLVTLAALLTAPGSARAAITAVSGSITQWFPLEQSPPQFPPESDDEIFAFDEHQFGEYQFEGRDLLFPEQQRLDWGTIVPGTPVNSHYLELDPASDERFFRLDQDGWVEFDGDIIGIIWTSSRLDENLGAELPRSDIYFGLQGEVGSPYDSDRRGLGGADDLLTPSGNRLTIRSSDIVVEFAGAVDGIRVLTSVPEPSIGLLLAVAVFLPATRLRLGR